MMPVIYRIPLINLDIPGYGLMMMVGFLLSVIWGARRATRSGASPDVVLNLAFVALFGGVGGARAMYVVHYWDQFAYRGNWTTILWAIVDVRQGGLEIYGGVIAALVVALIYLGFWRYSVRWYLDIVVPSLALGMSIGRIGCFLNGCCWGNLSDLPWAMRFSYGSNPATQQWYAGEPGAELPQELIYFPPNGILVDGRPAFPLQRELLWTTERDIADARPLLDLDNRYGEAKTPAEKAKVSQELSQELRRLGCRASAASQRVYIARQMDRFGLTLPELQAIARQYRALPVHPTQLYSLFALLLLALLLNAVYWRRTRDGQVLCVFLLIEPWSRYAIEVLRADNPVDTLGTFTISQFLAVVFSPLGLIGLIALRFLPPRSPRARLWEPPEEETSGRKRKRRPAKARA